MIRRTGTILLLGSMLVLPALGCQTYTGGMTLPGPVYRNDPRTEVLQRESEELKQQPAPLQSDPTPGAVPPAPTPMPPQPEKKSLGKRIVELFAGAKPPAKLENAPIPESSIPSSVPSSPIARSQSPDSPTDALQGSFVRETETGTLTLTFNEKRLKIRYAMKVKGQEKPQVVCAEADYSKNKLGQVFGVISSIDSPDADTSKMVPFLLAAEREGDPFSFRTRLDDGMLTISDWRINGASSADADKKTAFRPFLGKFKRPESQAPPISVVPASFPAVGPSAAPTTPNTIPPIRDGEVFPMPMPAKQLKLFGGYFPSDFPVGRE